MPNSPMKFAAPTDHSALHAAVSGKPEMSTMTFLFTDIEGSTRQWEQVPDMHGRVERHFEMLRRTVGELGGSVFATMGDGIAASFPSAEAALNAAIGAQLELPRLGLRVRMGIHTGEAQRAGPDFRGRTINRAARIMGLGHGGQILLSNVTAAIVTTGPNPVDLLDRGTHDLRDFSEPERIWQVDHPALRTGAAPSGGRRGASSNLPIPRTSLVGRACQVARGVELLGLHRLVTLTGVGGVGKTRLAIQIASEAPARFARVWFVDLTDVSHPDDVPGAIARVLDAGTAPEPLAAARAVLATKPMLLVLDNCEHLVGAAATTVDSLLTACPDLSVIATSREALGVDGECVTPVQPLDPETTAVELFRERAKSAGVAPEMVDDDDARLICSRLDGLPLAIELMAGSVAALGTSSIVRMLDERLDVLPSGRPRGTDRHGTMRTTIDWSYRLLEPTEQRLFQWMAMFSNGFELDAAIHVSRAIGTDAATATRSVAGLVARSMVTTDAGPHGVRFRLLETMRSFALEKLRESGQHGAAARAQAEWVATITHLPVDNPCSAVVERNSIRLEREADNWRTAMLLAGELRSSDLARRLCGPPTQFFLLGRHDLADVVRPLLDVCADDSYARRSVLCALCVSGAAGTDAGQLTRWADEVQQLDAVDHTGLGPLMRWLAHVWSGDFVAAVDVCVSAARDQRLARSTRDMFVSIAVLDHFSLTDATADTHRLIDAALDIADRSDVALQRVSALLGVAWGIASADPGRAVQLVHRAMTDIERVPALTRLTLPGSASRLLAGLDPRFAAEGLLAQLDAAASCPSFVDLIPVSYASALLNRVGHPAAGVALATLTVSSIAPYLSMMDFVDLARRTSSSHSAVSLEELESAVRSGLEDIVTGRHRIVAVAE